MKYPQTLSADFKSNLRFFVYYYTNGTLEYVIGDNEILKNIDYRNILVMEASLVETVFVIYCHNIKMDESGKVVNQVHSMKRAAQYIRSVCDPDYKVAPAFELWEMELY